MLYSSIEHCDIIACGSIVEIAANALTQAPCYVWGSGLLNDGAKIHHPRLHICGVRGRLTAARVTGRNVAVGDPALLCRRLLKGPNRGKRWRVGVIPHYVDRAEVEVKRLVSRLPHAVTIDVRWPVHEVLEYVAACEFILSSSLHGLVVADGMGVANQWIRPSRRVLGNGYKFQDHASVFGRYELKPCDDIAGIDAQKILAWQDAYNRPNLESVENEIIASFPRPLVGPKWVQSWPLRKMRSVISKSLAHIGAGATSQ